MAYGQRQLDKDNFLQSVVRLIYQKVIRVSDTFFFEVETLLNAKKQYISFGTRKILTKNVVIKQK